MTPQVQNPTKEDTKQPEPNQIVERAGGALSAQNSTDLSQASLLAFQGILTQQLEQQEARLRQRLIEEAKKETEPLQTVQSAGGAVLSAQKSTDLS